jgi:hypothetical protein
METGMGGRQVTGSFVGHSMVGREVPPGPPAGPAAGPEQREAAPGLEAGPATSHGVPPCEFPPELEVAMGEAFGESGNEAARGLGAPEARSAAAAAPRAVAPAEAPAETHYRVLGLPPQASREQIERAFRFCNEMYGPASLATYSLLEPSDVEATRTRIDEAYAVLMDPGRRRAYDENLGLRAPGAVPYPPAQGGGDAQPLGGEPVELPEVVTGPALKRVRERRGISLRQIATESKVGVRYLQYIEEDRFSFLPAPVYLRGFLSEYARVVGLDARRVVESYIARIGRSRQ